MAEDLQLTPVDPDDELDFHRAIVRHFDEDTDDADLEPWKGVIPLDRSVVARDEGRIVANFAAFPVDLSVPGGGRVACAAVTAVGVRSTHRRQRLLTRMMVRGFEQARDNGEVTAALYASESPIYPRFGYGATAPMTGYRVDLTRTRFQDPVGEPVTEVEPQQAVDRFPAIYEAVRVVRPGGVGRTPELWRLHLTADPASWRDGATPRRLVQVADRGYAAYRVKADFVDGLPAGEVRVLELVAADADAERALWQHLASLDLVTTMRAGLRPADDLLPWIVEDRLRLRASEDAPLYTRILDVPRCLSARASAASDALVLEVHDPFWDQSGTYRWETGSGAATCTRTDDPPDVVLDISGLSTVWLGGTSPLVLRDAGRLTEVREGSVGRLARMLWWDRAPWTPWEF